MKRKQAPAPAQVHWPVVTPRLPERAAQVLLPVLTPRLHDDDADTDAARQAAHDAITDTANVQAAAQTQPEIVAVQIPRTSVVLPESELGSLKILN